jgi:hypothetical protein
MLKHWSVPTRTAMRGWFRGPSVSRPVGLKFFILRLYRLFAQLKSELQRPQDGVGDRCVA